MAGWHLGLIGDGALDGGGLLEEAQEIAVGSAFGEPSGAVTMGRIGGVRVTLLARRGAGHRLSPSYVNYRANIDVLKRCGVTDVLAVSAVRSLREDLSPGDAVAVEQFIDRTAGREHSFFDAALTAHVDMADPVCPRLTGLAAAAAEAGATVHRAGCYVAIDGPQWPARAETGLYREWGGDVAGMTGMPEAALAREAELPYALIAMVAEPGSPTAGESSFATLRHLAAMLPETREASPIDRALNGAVVTPPEHWDAQAAARLDAVAGRILRQGRPEWF